MANGECLKAEREARLGLAGRGSGPFRVRTCGRSQESFRRREKVGGWESSRIGALESEFWVFGRRGNKRRSLGEG